MSQPSIRNAGVAEVQFLKPLELLQLLQAQVPNLRRLKVQLFQRGGCCKAFQMRVSNLCGCKRNLAELTVNDNRLATQRSDPGGNRIRSCSFRTGDHSLRR